MTNFYFSKNCNKDIEICPTVQPIKIYIKIKKKVKNRYNEIYIKNLK